MIIYKLLVKSAYVYNRVRHNSFYPMHVVGELPYTGLQISFALSPFKFMQYFCQNKRNKKTYPLQDLVVTLYMNVVSIDLLNSSYLKEYLLT